MTQIGLIGTGLMGLLMAQRLLSVGYTLTVYNRTTGKAAALASFGATIALTVPDLLANSEVIILTLSDAAVIHSVLLAPEAQPGLVNRTVIQMGTIAPAESQAIAQAIRAAGGHYLEAPVLGSIPEAKAGTLFGDGGG